jgi:hypothetical protein
MGRLLRHIWDARPGLSESSFGAIAWAALVAASLLAGDAWQREALHPEWMRLGLMSAVASAPALALSLWVMRALPHRGGTRGYALAFLVLATLTLGLSALIFAADFWLYFSQWHAAPFSKLWIVQFVFTFASAVYQFLVSGLRMHVPFGVLLLFPAALLLSRRTSR